VVAGVGGGGAHAAGELSRAPDPSANKPTNPGGGVGGGGGGLPA